MPILGGLPPGTAVAFEAASGWGWLVELESEPHLVHPSRCKVIASARLKNDKVDAATLAQLLRALLRRRAALVRWSTSLKTTRNPYQGLWSRGSGSARSGSR
jgi:hypothetical protein